MGINEKAKHPNNKLSTQHMDAAAALITSILTRVATALASLRTNDEQRTLLQLFLPENFILGYYCTACENHFKSRNYCRIDAHKEFRQSVSAFPSIVFLNNPSKSVRIPVDFDPNDEALLSVPYWKLLAEVVTARMAAQQQQKQLCNDYVPLPSISRVDAALLMSLSIRRFG